jgi:hypothetical protein
LGILQAQLAPSPLFRREIQRVRELTDKPFGVNLILHFPVDERVAICVAARVPRGQESRADEPVIGHTVNCRPTNAAPALHGIPAKRRRNW